MQDPSRVKRESPRTQGIAPARGPKKLQFQLSEAEPARGKRKHAPQNGLSERSQSTPDLVDQTEKQGSRLKRNIKSLKDKWGSGSSQDKLNSAYSDTNISAIPHHDLEFPSHEQSELISMVRDIQSFTAHSTAHSRPPGYHYQGWKLFKRGIKYQVPPEFSLYWAVTDISPNLRFKTKLYFDPDRRQFYVTWDTQLGQITYFDGARTFRTECKTSASPDNIFCLTVRGRALQLHCNEETVVEWVLISDQKILCVQPARFSGRYYLTAAGATPPKNSPLQQGISMLELENAGSVTDSEDRSSESGQPSLVGDYDDTTIKFSRSDRNLTSFASANFANSNHRHLLASQSCPAENNHNSSAHEPRRRTQSASSRELNMVRQLSSEVVSLTTQLQNDFRNTENAFRDKIKKLDLLSRNVVQTLTAIQRENRDRHTEEKRRQAEQLNYTLNLEDRIAKLEDCGSEYTSLSDGFENVIQQFIDSDGFSAPSLLRSNRLPQNIEQQLQALSQEMNEKLKSLNKRIKSDQSSVVKELHSNRHAIEQFKEDMDAVVNQLEGGINSCSMESRVLHSKHEDKVREHEDEFLKVQDQHSTFDMRLNSLDAALEDLEQNHLEDELGKHYSTLHDLSSGDYEGREHILPSIQEDNRMEDLEQMCRDMMEHMQLQAQQMETLREENLLFRAQIRQDLGLAEDVQEDTIPTEAFIDGERSP